MHAYTVSSFDMDEALPLNSGKRSQNLRNSARTIALRARSEGGTAVLSALSREPTLRSMVGAALGAAETPDGRVDMVFAASDEATAHDQLALRTWRVLRQTPFAPAIGGFSIEEMKKVCGLQAADFLAWELGREFQEMHEPPADRPQRPMRESLRQLLMLIQGPTPRIRCTAPPHAGQASGIGSSCPQ